MGDWFGGLGGNGGISGGGGGIQQGGVSPQSGKPAMGDGPGSFLTGVGKSIKKLMVDPTGTTTGVEAAKSAVKATEDAITNKVTESLWDLAQATVDGAQIVFRLVAKLLLEGSTPQITGDFIYQMGGRIFFISLPLIMLFALFRIIAATVRARALDGVRDAALGAAGSVIGTVLSVPLTAIAVGIMDSIAGGLLSATLDDADKFVDDIVQGVVMLGTAVGNMVADNPGTGPVEAWAVPATGVVAAAVIIIILGGILFFACLSIGLVLVARNMLLYIVTVTAPIMLSGLAWAPTRAWAGKFLGWQTALIFAKLAIVVVFGLGVLAVTDSTTGDNAAEVLGYFMTVLSGLLMLFLACFVPAACFPLFGFLGAHGAHELDGLAHAAQARLSSVPSNAIGGAQTAFGRLQDVLSNDHSSGVVGGDTAGGTSTGTSGPSASTEPSTSTVKPGTGGMAGAGSETGAGAAEAGTAAEAGAEVAAGSTGVGLAAVAAWEAGKAVAGGAGKAVGRVVGETQTAMHDELGAEQPAGGSGGSSVAAPPPPEPPEDYDYGYDSAPPPPEDHGAIQPQSPPVDDGDDWTQPGKGEAA